MQRLDGIICNNKQRRNNDKCRYECKELIDKGVCDKGYIWNLYIGEYLDYESCKCRKRLVDKVWSDECDEIIEEVKILDKNEDKCSSCILYIVLFSIFFTINVAIATYFVYYKYVSRNKENVSKYYYIYQTTI